MIFSPKNADDIRKYYKDTFVKFKETGDQLFYITGVDQYKVTGKHETDPDGFTIYLDNATPYEVEYILPHKSFFQYGTQAVQLQRIPAKQYHRGLCSLNCGLFYLNGNMEVKQHTLDFKSLGAFVKKQNFKNLTQAIAANDLSSVALNSRMMYHRVAKTLYIDFVQVAKVNSTKKQIVLLQSIFRDEILEFLKNTNEHNDFRLILPEEKTPVVRNKMNVAIHEAN